MENPFKEHSLTFSAHNCEASRIPTTPRCHDSLTSTREGQTRSIAIVFAEACCGNGAIESNIHTATTNVIERNPISSSSGCYDSSDSSGEASLVCPSNYGYGIRNIDKINQNILRNMNSERNLRCWMDVDNSFDERDDEMSLLQHPKAFSVRIILGVISAVVPVYHPGCHD